MTPKRLELEPSRGEFTAPPRDHRPLLPEPPPVRLVAVEDVHLPAAAGNEIELDAFYIGMLKFEREVDAAEPAIIYRAENARLWFDVQEPPLSRSDFRPTYIEVPLLREVEKKLIELEIEYQWQRGLHVGNDQLVLLDPAGNWVSLGQIAEIR